MAPPSAQYAARCSGPEENFDQGIFADISCEEIIPQRRQTANFCFSGQQPVLLFIFLRQAAISAAIRIADTKLLGLAVPVPAILYAVP